MMTKNMMRKYSNVWKIPIGLKLSFEKYLSILSTSASVENWEDKISPIGPITSIPAKPKIDVGINMMFNQINLVFVISKKDKGYSRNSRYAPLWNHDNI